MTMRALTIRQPWASAIMHGGKDVENRTWATKHRGMLWIHAGLKRDWGARQAERALRESRGWYYHPSDAPLGMVLGFVQLVDVVEDSVSEWAEPGMKHWILADPFWLNTPEPMRGRQGLWTPRFDGSIMSLYGEPGGLRITRPPDEGTV